MTDQFAWSNNPRLDLVETLGKTILLLSASENVKSACEQFHDDVKRSGGAPDATAVKQFERAVEPLTTLVRTVDRIDPHVLTTDELEGLETAATDDLVRQAVTKGSLRERRLLLQARDVKTNRWIARAAVLAIFVNACATIGAALIKP